MYQAILVIVFLGTIFLLNAGFSIKLGFIALLCLLGILILNITYNLGKLKNLFHPNRSEFKETAVVSLQLVILIVGVIILVVGFVF